LTVFYTHVLELARLVQSSKVPQDLDPVEIVRREDQWSWSVSLSLQVKKLWANLQAVLKQVQVRVTRAHSRRTLTWSEDACTCTTPWVRQSGRGGQHQTRVSGLGIPTRTGHWDLWVEEVVLMAVVFQTVQEAAEVLALPQQLLAVRQRLDWLLCLLQDVVDYLGDEVLVRVSGRLQATRSNNQEVLALLHSRRA
jgi:hypothetical protein